jgi:hypothetical protein
MRQPRIWTYGWLTIDLERIVAIVEAGDNEAHVYAIDDDEPYTFTCTELTEVRAQVDSLRAAWCAYRDPFAQDRL